MPSLGKRASDYETWTTGRLRKERDKAIQESDSHQSWAEVLDDEIQRRFKEKENAE